ncbi:MAG: NfeD family protein [Betaproteobacteria bacterium]|nr:NfeD family protein [Betaproteobacteria bacterium]
MNEPSMNSSLLWVGTGLILIVAELVTGTFYLLVLGLACMAGAAASFVGLGAEIQTILAALVAVLGALWVRRHNQSKEQPKMPSLDLGQAVRWESWVSEADRLARVSYRGASWDAKIEGEFSGTPQEVFYITEISGNQLTVSKAKR